VHHFSDVAANVKINTEIHFNKWSVSGNSQRNRALDQIKDGWVYFLDDDNILHPQLFPVIKTELHKKQCIKVFIFRQYFDYDKNVIRAATPSKVKAQSIDAAQFLVNASVIGFLDRWRKETYYSDGSFISAIVAKNNPYDFMFLSGILCYYNAMSVPSLVSQLNC
jgi:glycosyltransferase involved in cell wall biosynthesis